MTLYDIIHAIPGEDTVTVADYIDGQIYADRKTPNTFLNTPLYFVLQNSLVYKLEVGNCFNDLIIHIYKN